MNTHFSEYADLPAFSYHQFIGSYIAKEEFKMEKDVVEAIEFHATGNYPMSRLAKIIYASDKIEPTRGFDSSDLINSCLENDEEPRRVFKSSAKDSTRRSLEITLQDGTRDLSDARAAPTTRALGGRRPLLRVGNRAAGACVASSPDSDLEAFSHNPAHGSFAPLAFQPSAMTNCANQRFLSY